MMIFFDQLRVLRSYNTPDKQPGFLINSAVYGLMRQIMTFLNDLASYRDV